MSKSSEVPDGSTNLSDEQKAETADVGDEPDTASGGAPEK